jgi:sulfoxide reductase heme-binding subunit YedZ
LILPAWPGLVRRLTAPWTERSGRFSPLKAAFLMLVLAPGLWLTVELARGELQPLPHTAVIRETGLWAIRFLILTLAITPLRRMLAWPKLISVRRMLGVAALAYTSVHLLAWIADMAYDWVLVASEITMRLYLAVGALGLVLMIPLGITSTDAMVKRVGGRRWRRLHQLVYAVGVLAILHFYLLLQKLTTPEAQIVTGLFLWMMAWRTLVAWRGAIDPAWAAGLAVGAGVLTMFLEVAYYAVFTSISNPWLVFSANATLEAGVRPGWWIMGIGSALAAAAVVRSRKRGRAA